MVVAAAQIAERSDGIMVCAALRDVIFVSVAAVIRGGNRCSFLGVARHAVVGMVAANRECNC